MKVTVEFIDGRRNEICISKLDEISISERMVCVFSSIEKSDLLADKGLVKSIIANTYYDDVEVEELEEEEEGE